MCDKLKWASPQALMDAVRKRYWPHLKMQDPKKVTHYTYVDGPMMYLGQQIVRAMQDAGFPAKISECYRSAERQRQLKAQGFSKAEPYASPHQYYLAVDIIHPSMGWDVPREYWDALHEAVLNVEKKFGVDLRHGYDWDGDGIAVLEDSTEKFWDPAHVELKAWREWRYRWGTNKPEAKWLAECFEAVLPAVWKKRPMSAG